MKKFHQYLFLILLLTSTNSRVVRHPFDVFSKHKTFVESHRGVNREIFQNTMEAFSRAMEYDIESFETDVWLSKDKVLVLVHGGALGDLSGFYDHGGSVTNFTWEQLSTFRTVQDHLKMPRLDETMQLTKNKIFMNLEIKDPRIDEAFPAIVKLIEDYDYFDQIALSSFHHDYYKKVEEYNQNHEKKLVFGFLFSKGKQSQYDYTKKGHTLNIYWTDATKEVCTKAHQNGMAIQAWFDMSEPEHTHIYKQLIQNGADIICSNNPLLAKMYRDNYYEPFANKIKKLIKKKFR
jgi:glycerophosphoryl diester phosphodiesterase